MLRGTLDDFTLADIFKLLSFSKKTGRVELKRKAGMGRVFFRDGEVYFAESSLSREPLGQKLIRSRALSDSHLRRALDENSESGERVGQILLREGWINEEQLEAAVKQQIEDAVFDLLRWELGDFEWEPNVTLEPEVPISVSVENLIMESSRRLDELETISRKVPSTQAVVAVAPAPPEGAVEINITPDEWRVLVLVDGHRTVETIANTIGLDEFQTMRIVHGMVSAGLVEVAGSDEGQAATLAPPPPTFADGESAAAPSPTSEDDVSDGLDAVEPAVSSDPAPEAPEEPVREEAVEEAPSEEAPVESDIFSSFDLTPRDESQATSATPEAAGSPDADDVVEETLYRAPTGSDGDGVPAENGTSTPPSEWFEDPDLSMELFDSPARGDLTTELPNESDDVAPPEDSTFTTDDAPEHDDVELATDGGPAEMPDTQEPVLRRPPPPPVAAAEGAERSRAVRELSDLFEDVPVERPKRPAIRRIEPVDPVAKRRVEDDEQVTKSLISRLIEGVKGL